MAMAVEYFHIRESDYDLMDQLVELETQIHQKGGLSVFEIHSFIRYGRVYAAVEYDEVLGCVYFMRDFDNPGKAFLYGILIKPGETSKRLAETLLLSAFSDLKDSGIRMVEVTVHPSNHKAIRIYRDMLDFHIINLGDDEDPADEDFLELRKTL